MEKVGIVAFAFGVPETITPNRLIGEIVVQQSKKLGGAAVFTQKDVLITDKDISVTYVEERPGSPPPTLRIAREAIRWAVYKGITTLYIVAAKPHLWRCQRDLALAVEEARVKIKVRVCEEVKRYPENIWFSEDSTQARTQSKENWEKRERWLKAMPVFLYKLIAG